MDVVDELAAAFVGFFFAAVREQGKDVAFLEVLGILQAFAQGVELLFEGEKGFVLGVEGVFFFPAFELEALLQAFLLFFDGFLSGEKVIFPVKVILFVGPVAEEGFFVLGNGVQALGEFPDGGLAQAEGLCVGSLSGEFLLALKGELVQGFLQFGGLCGSRTLRRLSSFSARRAFFASSAKTRSLVRALS